MCKGPGPRVDYKETRGPLCKMAGNFGWGFIFQRIKSWTGSTRGEPGRARAVHRGPKVARTEGAGARWRAHRSTASGCSGAPKLTGRGAKERGVRLGPHRSSGGGVVTGQRQWHEAVMGTRWGGVLAWERRREGLGEVWGAPGVVGVVFIGPGEPGEGWPGLTPTLMALTPLKTGGEGV
jgi:hypothetical protein